MKNTYVRFIDADAKEDDVALLPDGMELDVVPRAGEIVILPDASSFYIHSVIHQFINRPAWQANHPGPEITTHRIEIWCGRSPKPN